jgi:hypothetical protein
MANLTQKKIRSFWLPLASTWLMMAIEGPFLAAIIARLPDEKTNLAAYGIAYALGLIIEAPVIMLMSASAALVKNWQTYLKLRAFTHFLNIAITLIMVIIVVPIFFRFVMMNLAGFDSQLVLLSNEATAALLIWPAAIGYRRFYQGILIREGKTRKVAYGTVIRLLAMSVTAIIIWKFSNINGALLGALSLSAGVFVEAILIRLMASSSIVSLKENPTNDSSVISYHEIIQFYYPLALTTLLSLAVQPLITFFMGKSLFPMESLAVLPVINALVFIFRSLGLSYQEVVITFLAEAKENYKALLKFARKLSAFVTITLAAIAFTPLAEIYFGYLSGLELELIHFSIGPTQIMVLIPATSLLLSWQRAILVHQKQTSPITFATCLEVAIIIVVLSWNISYGTYSGVTGAALALVLGRLASVAYLKWKLKFA